MATASYTTSRNVTDLAKRLETSRTLLREPLNWLVAEGFLTFRSGQASSAGR